MFKFRLPMRLQFFADPENNGDNADPKDSTKNTNPDVDPKDDNANDDDKPTDDKADEIVEKLRHRIGQEQAHKNELKEQLEKANAELEKLRKGEKPEKEKPLTPEQKQINELKSQLNREHILKDTSKVFEESGVSVPDDVINIFVSNDRDKTIDNARLLMDWAGNIRKSTEDAMREKYQKGYVPKDPKHNTSTSSFGKKVSELDKDRAPLDKFM